ncbi:hypothetical protein CICLE_v10026879mg [Citrus x clementina]|uniref:Uncharacterized protein n=1 Tax=Citrus clementina TaxID=85681 RepID=V4SIE2_CITCL|nr:hypothetical protein CICLE_v10026879mg [Citrus x clementina]
MLYIAFSSIRCLNTNQKFFLITYQRIRLLNPLYITNSSSCPFFFFLNFGSSYKQKLAKSFSSTHHLINTYKDDEKYIN